MTQFDDAIDGSTSVHDTQWRAFPALEPLETHSGLVFGSRRTPLPPDREIPEEDCTIREVLEQIVLPGISRSPCLVAFSGGRDSSALLALATHVARRHGFEDPIPITYLFDEHPRSREEEWQELTLRHLGLREREIVRGAAVQLDSLGELARRTLRRHGLFWPPNLHSLVPLLEAARGGALITGKGGDEIFATPETLPSFDWSVARHLPRRRAVNYILSGLLPTPLGLRFKYRKRLALKWLRPAARREVQRLFFARFDDDSTDAQSLVDFNESRYLETFAGSASVLAEQADADLVSPFVHPRFFGAWMRNAPATGFPSRAAAMETLFGDLLPPASPRRSTKAVFTEVFWGPRCREFATGWSGTGLDMTLIDPDALRKEWSKSPPDFRAVAPLQAAWLASQRGDRTEENRPKLIPPST